jgi:ATP-dependent 26S proteasome regulatory subunit
MKNLKQFTLIDAIERVAAKAKESKLDDQLFIDCKEELELLSGSYGITTRQAVIFTVFLDRNCRYVDYDDLASYLDISNIRILSYSDDVEALTRRRLLRYHRRGKDEDTFIVPSAVLRALKHNEAYHMPPNTGLDCCELFARLKVLFDDLGDETITPDELSKEVGSLLEQNQQLSFARKVWTLKVRSIDRLLLVLFCHLLVNEDDDDVRFNQIEPLYENSAIFMRLRSEMSNDANPLMDLKLIEHLCADGIADNNRFHLTEQAKRDLLAELNISVAADISADVMKPDSIGAKELFYCDKVGRQVEELASLLDAERYKEVHERMKQKGFRQAFTCLFHGGPGTGKTETVYQLARRTGRQVMVVDVPQIKSKWVGESEKNIKALFDRYRTLVAKFDVAPILLFNEADAIIGIRKQGAQNAVDKMENTIQNIILQEMESLDGILIATTNLTENLDSAFERRFLYKIRFEQPDAAVRSKIWKTMIPELPTDIADALACEYDFSGGQIENIARKYAVNCILHGDAADTQDTLEELCGNEKINTTATRRIGFAA